MTGARGDAYRDKGGDNKLDYSKRHITDEEVSRLQLLKQQHYTYEEVDFSCNELSAAGLRAVLDLCHRCEKLRILKLYKNRIDDQGAEGLAELVERCPSIEEMHLSHNHFSGDGVLKIITAADRYRGKHLPPLWLRLEQNDVQNPIQTLKEMMRSLSVCDRRDERKCTNRVCCWGQKIHLPFFQLQRGTYSGKGRGRGGGGEGGASAFTTQEERRQPVVLTARSDLDAPLVDCFDTEDECRIRLDSRQREVPDNLARRCSPSRCHRERHGRDRRRRAALREGLERHRRGGRRSPSFWSGTPSPRRATARRAALPVALREEGGDRGGLPLREASRPRRHHRRRHHRQRLGTTSSAALPAWPEELSVVSRRSRRRLRSPAHLDDRAEAKRRRISGDEMAGLGRRSRRHRHRSGGDREHGRRRCREKSLLQASVAASGGLAAMGVPPQTRQVVATGLPLLACGGGGGAGGASVAGSAAVAATGGGTLAGVSAVVAPRGSRLLRESAAPLAAALRGDRSPSTSRSSSSSTGSSSSSGAVVTAAAIAPGSATARAGLPCTTTKSSAPTGIVAARPIPGVGGGSGKAIGAGRGVVAISPEISSDEESDGSFSSSQSCGGAAVVGSGSAVAVAGGTAPAAQPAPAAAASAAAPAATAAAGANVPAAAAEAAPHWGGTRSRANIESPARGAAEGGEEPAWGSPSPSSERRWHEDRGCPPPSPSPAAERFSTPGTTKSPRRQAGHRTGSEQGHADGMNTGVKERMSMLKERLTQKWQGSKAPA